MKYVLNNLVIWLSMTIHNILTCTTDFRCPSKCFCIYPNRLSPYFTVDCSSSELTTQPAALPKCINMDSSEIEYRLNFSNNLIREFPPEEYVTHTERLDISMNFLSDIDGLLTMDNLHLRKLYLHKNQIRTLPNILNSTWFHRIEILALHGNPWLCDCSLLWLKFWLDENPNKTKHLSLIQCHAPEDLALRPIINVTVDEFCRVSQRNEPRTGLKGWEIGLIVLGVILYVLIMTLLACCVVMRQREKIQLQQEHEMRDINNLATQDAVPS